MKKAGGYTVIELLVTVSLLVVLTSISFIGITSPQQLLKKEILLFQIAEIMNQVKMEPLFTGHPTTLSFTPWALWVNDKKRLEFPLHGAWEWKSKIKDLKFQANSTVVAIGTDGRIVPLPQAVILTYNKNSAAKILFDPSRKWVCFIKTGELKHDTCLH